MIDKKVFINKGYKFTYLETKEEASKYINSTLDNTTIGIGGSKTVEQLELYDTLSTHNTVYWHWKDKEAKPLAANTKVYITSCNGMSETGEIVNIDGTGNRLASMLYGHDKLIIIAGINKVEDTLEDAIYRARNIAAPLNARRFNLNTPCALSKELKCYDCKSKDRICKGMVILFEAMKGIKETEIILINENLGY